MYTIDMLVLLYFGKFLHELSQWQLKLPLHSNSPACSIIIFITQYHFLSLNNSSDKVSVENLHGGIMGFNGLILIQQKLFQLPRMAALIWWLRSDCS